MLRLLWFGLEHYGLFFAIQRLIIPGPTKDPLYLTKSDLSSVLTCVKMFSTDGRFEFQDFFKQTLFSDRTENSV